MVDDNEPRDSIDPEEQISARNELARRCKEAGLELHEYAGGGGLWEIRIPAGRDSRYACLYSYEQIRRFLDVPFERYTFLSDYYAVCSYQDSLIEAAVHCVNSAYGLDLITRRLFSRGGTAESADDLPPIVLSPDAPGGITIVLGPATETLNGFYNYELGPEPHLSLHLSNTKVSQHDQAVSVLERVSNSLFFQIDLLTNISLALTRNRPHTRITRKRLTESLQYPTNEYDKVPASLYWYAKSAVGMPLLQFLAFYQVLEFYFPIYYRAEAHRKIRTILKDPTFRSDRDSDLSRILTAIQVSRSGNIGDERSQLRATLTECLDSDLLREYLQEDKDRSTFFSSKKKTITDYRLPIENDRVDLRNDVADRIYDIRCKIVHTKNEVRDGQIELLLPFSKEADQLQHDIALVEFIAKRVLISASFPLKLT